MKTIMYIRANGIYSDSRATKEIHTFLKAGYHVIVVGWDREGNSIEKCNEVFSNNPDVEFFLYGKKVKDHIGFKNIFKLFFWLLFVKKVFNNNKGRINIIHACNLDTCPLFYKKCRKNSIKLVYDIYDYYVDVHTMPSFMLYMVEGIEIDIINRADVTIICTDERREQIVKANPKKVIVIHNTPDVEFITEDPIYDYFYCGTFCIRRLLEEIFDSYPENSDLKVGFAGYGIYKDKALKLQHNHDNFTYLNQIKYSDCLKNEAKSICLSAIYEPTIRNHKLCAPNKFYEALALGKPIIVCSGTGIDKIVKEHDIGIIIDYDVKQFYDAVRYLRINAKLCADMGKRARKLYDEKYSWALMRNELLAAYDDLNN